MCAVLTSLATWFQLEALRRSWMWGARTDVRAAVFDAAWDALAAAAAIRRAMPGEHSAGTNWDAVQIIHHILVEYALTIGGDGGAAAAADVEYLNFFFFFSFFVKFFFIKKNSHTLPECACSVPNPRPGRNAGDLFHTFAAHLVGPPVRQVQIVVDVLTRLHAAMFRAATRDPAAERARSLATAAAAESEHWFESVKTKLSAQLPPTPSEECVYFPFFFFFFF
jgi:hypothetical protein